MSALSIQPPFPILTDTDGSPLENGYIWIGTVNLPAQTNPITVYWDAALTITATQPIRTQGGYPSRNGSPARLYVNSDYSILVQNKNGSMVYSAPAATERISGDVISTLNASQVVYDPAGTNAVPTTVQAKLRETVSVFDFMTAAQIADVQAGTSTDDTAAIQAALSAAAVSGAELLFQPGTYRMLAPLVTSVSLRGVKNKTFIEFPNGFANPIAPPDIRGFYMVYNTNFSSLTYNPSTADNIEIQGITFLANQTSDADIQGVLGFANTNGLKVHDCEVRVPAIAAVRTCITLHGANKNAAVYLNTLTNLGTLAGGGSIWVEGISGTALDESGASENIIVYGNTIYHPDQGVRRDEPIAVWGAQGIVQDVDVFANYIDCGNSSNAITVFTTASGSATFNITRRIKVRDNRIKAVDNRQGISVGGSNLPNTLTDVEVSGNTVAFSFSSGYTPANNEYAIRHFSGTQVGVTGNIIRNTGSQTVSRGIAGLELVAQNTITGPFTYSIENAQVVSANVILNTATGGFGVYNGGNVSDNKITADLPVRNLSVTCQIRGNDLVMFDSSGTAQSVYVSGTCDAVVEANKMTMNNATQRAALFQNTGQRVLRNNIFTGTGRGSNGILTQAGGNYWFSYYDDLVASGSADGDIRLNYPLGFITKNPAPTVDANSMILSGWQLYDNAGTRTWYPLYLSGVSPAV